MNRKKIIPIFLSLFLLFLEKSYGGLLGGHVPKGKEIKDPYLEQLFAPEFPYESIKIVETDEGKRYVLIKAKARVNDERRSEYAYKFLRTRGIVIHQEGSPRTDILYISEMRLYRVVTEKPYVVEYCEVKGDSHERKPGVESVVRNEGKYLIIRINKDFGKVFKRVEIYPEEEAKCPEPPFVGKYPNSRSIVCTENNKWFSFTFVTKDKGKEIYDYYKDRLKTHYKKIGFNFPEESWKAFGAINNLGMQIESSEVAWIKRYLDPSGQETSITSPVPLNGIVFHIVINEIGLKPIIEEHSLIRIFYSTDNERINRNIERMKRLYPEGVK